MADEKMCSKTRDQENAHAEQRHVLQAAIAEDQRQYVEGVREWLRDSLANKGKTVGGPIQ